MLACAPDEEHELPLVALAAALAERGIATTLLGARTPAAAPTAAAPLEGGLLVVFALRPPARARRRAGPTPERRVRRRRTRLGPHRTAAARPLRQLVAGGGHPLHHRPARGDGRTAMTGAWA